MTSLLLLVGQVDHNRWIKIRLWVMLVTTVGSKFRLRVIPAGFMIILYLKVSVAIIVDHLYLFKDDVYNI